MSVGLYDLHEEKRRRKNNEFHQDCDSVVPMGREGEKGIARNQSINVSKPQVDTIVV